MSFPTDRLLADDPSHEVDRRGACTHLVRYGVMGNVGRFRPLEPAEYPRGRRVLIRTMRGLETGEVLLSAMGGADMGVVDGSIVRPMTPQDELVVARLERDRVNAIDDCQRLLNATTPSVLLVDAELMFDGSAVFFYFHGAFPSNADDLLSKLSHRYEARIGFRNFAEAVETGCGPDCGTESADGAGCGNCSTGCKLSDHCGVTHGSQAAAATGRAT